jgi:hypothetical protein
MELDAANDTAHSNDAMGYSAAPVHAENTRNRAADALAKAPVGRYQSGIALEAPANSAAQGNSIPGQLFSSALYGSFFVGPFQLGVALRTGDMSGVDVTVLVGTAVNVLVTGWVLNMIAARPSPFDSFGLLASLAAQAGAGAFLQPMAAVKPSTAAPPPRQWG